MNEVLASLSAYASDSYVEAAARAASGDPSRIRRMIEKIRELKDRYGKRIFKHAVVLALIAAALTAILKALENPTIADNVARTTGKLRAVAELTALGFALYKMVTAILDMFTPADDAYGDPSIRRRLDEIASKNAELERVLRDVDSQMQNRETNKHRNAGQENVEELRRARDQGKARKERRSQEAWAATEVALQTAEKKYGIMLVAERLTERLQHFVQKYGKRALRHAAVLALAGAALAAMLKALRTPAIASRVMKTSGELEQVLRVTTLGFALYKITTVLLDFATPADEEQSVREKLDDLAEKNGQLNEALKQANENILVLERDRRWSLPAQRVREYKAARKASTQFRKLKVEPMATAALDALRAQYPNAVTGAELAEIPSYTVIDDVKFLTKIENMDAQQRARYAVRTARSPELTQTFMDRVISIMRRLRKDAVGSKVHRLGGFVVKWATIFAVQAIMFKMLVIVSKQKFFETLGYGTRLMLAGLCAVNSILVLVHTSVPEQDDPDIVKRVANAANRTKKLITQAPLAAAAA